MSRRKQYPNLFHAVANYHDFYGPSKRRMLYNLAKDDEDLMNRMERFRVYGVHQGCVNSICWNDSGTCILSGSDDQHLKIVDPFPLQPRTLWDYKTSHKSNIFSAHFLPCSDDAQIVSCSGDGLILFTDIHRTSTENSSCRFNCHEGTCYTVMTVPNESRTFLSCGEDGTVRYFDLRQKSSCDCHCGSSPADVLITTKRAVTSMAVNPLAPWLLAIGVGDSSIMIFDRRQLSVGAKNEMDASETCQVGQLVVPELEASDRYYRITSLTYTPTGSQLLASYSSDHVYLFDLKDDEKSRAFGASSADLNSELNSELNETKDKKQPKPNLKRLRLRGDWSDTGPNARPNATGSGEIAQARPTLHQSLMERMTLVLAQMLNETPSNAVRLPGDAPESGSDENPGTESNDSNSALSDLNQNPQNNSDTTSEQSSTGLSHHIPGIEDEFVNLRSSFVNRHRVEPGAVNLSYREGGGSAGLISYSVGNEVERGSHNSVPIEGEKPTSSSNAKKSWEKAVSMPRYPGGKIRMKFTGHRNARTMIKEANFYGDKFILSGSDCGHIFIWDKYTGRLVQILEADNHVVNNVQPHPFDPIIAASGIDYDVKLFAPTANDSTFNRETATELIKRNELMLEETKDTITVPAQFMIRMLSCLSHIRRSNASGRNSHSNNPQADPSQEENSGNVPDNPDDLNPT